MSSLRRRSAGFTIYELIVAVVLLGIAIHPLLSILATDTQTATDRQDRVNAARAVANEAALLAAIDPALIPSVRDYRVGASGQTDAAGTYGVRTTKEVRCGVGAWIPDSPTTEVPLGCPVGGAVADYTITVTFPRSAGASQETGAVTTRVSVPSSAVHPATTGGTP